MTMRMTTCTLAAALGLTLAHPASADGGRVTVDGIEYSYTVNADGEGVTLAGIMTDVNQLPETLVVPGTLGGKPVTEIAQKAFWDAPFVELTLPASLKGNGIVAMNFFRVNNLTNILVAAGNEDLVSKDGVLFSKRDKSGDLYSEDGLRLVAYPLVRAGAAYAIPEGTTRVDDNAFSYCQYLEKLTIPKSLGVDGNLGRPIEGCRKLARITVTEGNDTFHAEDGVLFYDSQRYPLQSQLLVYPAARSATAYTVPSHVTEVRPSAFACCEKLEKVTFPASVTALGNLVFDDSKKLKAMYFNGAPPDAENQTFNNTSSDLKVYYTDETHKAAWEAVYADGGKWTICGVKPPVSYWNAVGLPRDGETSWSTGTRTVDVPNAWLLDNVTGLTESSTAADVTAALAATGNNGISRGLSYLFGFEPDSDTPAAAQLKVSFDGFDAQGLPVIKWSPDQRTNDRVKDCVKYTIRAASSLGTAREHWDDYDTLEDELKKNSRFFYVEVEAQ